MAKNQNETATSTVSVNGESAKAEMTLLSKRADELKNKLKAASEAGDGKAFDKLSKQLKATQKEMKQLERDSFDLTRVLNNLSGASIGELKKAKKELDKQFNSPALERNSKEWKKIRDDLRSVKKEMSDLNSESKAGESGMSRFANGFNKYFAAVTAVIAGLTGLTMGLKKFVDMRNEIEDSQANLKSLTGLGDEDIDWLRNYAKELSTSTTDAGIRITASAKEIMDGFTTIGSKRPELLKNKEAMAAVTKEALTLAAAGKMDVATAFDVVTASMNQFNLGADQSQRIINAIAAGSLEGSAEADSLAGSLKNVGTVADGSNMTLEDTVALLEVLASKQLMGEEAGTKLRGAILKMKDAGVGYTSGAFNMRDAIVEVNKELDKKTSASQKDALMQKIFGAENITVGQILVKNVEAYDKLKVAITGTNTAYKQAEIQTNTISAKMAQAKNKFNEAGMSLVKNLNPAILSAMNITTHLIKGMASVVQISDSAANSFKEQKDKVMDLKLNLEPLLIRYDELATKAKRSSDENAELKKIVDKVASAMPGAVTQVDKYGNAIAISTTRVREYINAQVALYGVKNKEQIEDTKKTLADLEKTIVFHKKKIDEINKTGTYKVRTVSDKKTGDVYDVFATQEQIAAEQDLYKKLIQDRLGYQEYIKELSGQTLEEEIKAAEQKRKKELELAEKARKEEEARRKKEQENARKNAGSADDLTDKEREKAFKKEEDNLANKAKRRQLILDEMYRTGVLKELLYTKLSEQNEIMGLEEKLDLLKKYGKETIDVQTSISDAKLKQQNTDLKQVEDYKKSIEALNTPISVEEEIDDKDIVEFKKKYDLFVKIQEKYGLTELSDFEKTKKLELEILDEYLKKGLLSEKDAARVRALLASEEFTLKSKNLKDYAGFVNSVSSDMLNSIANFQSAEQKEIEIKYQKQIDFAEKAGRDTTDIEQKKNEELAKLRAENADSVFALQVASIIATTAMSAMDAYSSALKIPVAGPVLAPIAATAAIAFGASQLAEASAARDEAKAGYYDGGYKDGYTGGTDPKEVRGRFPDGSPYHGMEYIADHRTTGNQAFRKVFDLAEYAKKTNRISSITTRDIANAIGVNNGYYSGGYRVTDAGFAPNNASNPDYSLLVDALNESRAINAALLLQIRKGITSKTYIHGDGGIEDAQDLYSKIIKNGKRG